MLKKHPEFTHKVEYIGLENQPVLIVDNFLANPQLLIHEACTYAQFNCWLP